MIRRFQMQHERLCCAAATAPVVALPDSAVRTWFKPGLQEPTLEKQIADKTRKGPPVAHPLPNYRKAHTLIGSQRWKTANLVTNVASGKDYRLRDSHGEGRVDETGQYRDWLYGEERRFANYIGVTLFCTAMSIWYVTTATLGSESWDVPIPLLTKPPPTAGESGAYADQRREMDQRRKEDIVASAAGALAGKK